jgi:subtilisin family serine protease
MAVKKSAPKSSKSKVARKATAPAKKSATPAKPAQPRASSLKKPSTVSARPAAKPSTPAQPKSAPPAAAKKAPVKKTPAKKSAVKKAAPKKAAVATTTRPAPRPAAAPKQPAPIILATSRKAAPPPPPPRLNESADRLIAYVSPRSIGGINLFAAHSRLNYDSVDQFTSTPQDVHAACRWLQERRFEIVSVGPLNIRVAGSAALFQKHLGIKFEKRDPATPPSAAIRTMAAERASLAAGPAPSAPTPADPTLEPWQIPSIPYVPSAQSTAKLLESATPVIEGLAFPQPIRLFAPAADPPSPAYHHLKPPRDLVRLLNAAPVHRDGFHGQNVRAAMIDSGFQWSHPYFTSRNYQLKVALPEDSDDDLNGHGTGESANLLALAPKVTLYGLAMDDLIQAFSTARDTLGVQILSNSWGTALDTDGAFGTWDPFWTLVRAEILLCVRRGMIVVFAAGNGTGLSFTASMPEVISAGGVYIDDQGGKHASNYATSFESTRFPGQKVPFVCGLVGQMPRAIYITLPIPPRCDIDRAFGGRAFPQRDETLTSDGWGVFSGTSAACPQIAGAIALILSKHPAADLAEIRQRLSASAVDIIQGTTATGDTAASGVDLATGHGLVDVHAACQ